MKLCEDCNCVIPKKRMKVNPEAETCISCQQEREATGHFRRAKMYVHGKTKGGELDTVEQTIIK